MVQQVVQLLPVDGNGNAIQVMTLGANAADDIDGTSDRVALPTGATAGNIIRVAVNQDTYINFGTSSVTAAATDVLLPAGVEYMQVPAGSTHIAYLQVSAAGRISVTLMT